MLESLLAVLTPINVLLAGLGVSFGILFGAIPGLGPALGIALLIPMTYSLNPVSALAVIGGCFGGGIYGGCISSILINTPGTPGSVATTFDGYPLSEKGQAGYAIGAATSASAIGGIIGLLALMVFGPPIAKFSLNFGAAENFLLTMVGLTVIARTLKGNFIRGIISALLGLVLSFIGYDMISGYIRFSFGIRYLEDGIIFIPAIIGLFAVSQAFVLAEKGGTISNTGKIVTKNILEGALMPIKKWVTTVRSTLIGLILGGIPGIGIATANLIAYSETVRASKHPETFGKGNIEGVIAPEAANNAVQGGSLIPTLTLGIPGGATAAIFMGALNIYGIRIGYDLYSTNKTVLYSLIFSMIVSNILFLIIGLSFTKYLARVTTVKNEILVPLILIMCFLGAYTTRYSMGDVWIALIFGLFGYILRKLNFSIVCVVIALVLGPIAEQGFNRAMLISGGSYEIFVRDPISIILILLGMSVILSAFIDLIKDKRKKSISQ